MNNTQKTFYALTIISLLSHAYGLFGQLIHFFQGNLLNWSNLSYIFSTFSSVFFFIAGIIGVIKLVSNENSYNKWLKAYAIMSAFYFVLYLPYKLSMVLGLHPAFKDAGIFAIGAFFLFQSIFALIYFIVCIKHFNGEQKLFSQGASNKKGSRFTHYIIDSIFILFAGFNFMKSAGFLFGLNSGISSNWLFSNVSILFTLLIYYTISEGIFKQSFGKLITNHYVAKSDGSKASFGNIFIRTICRFIPFEAFSYLPSPMAKWHDKFSGTDVFEDSQITTGIDYTNDIQSTSFEEESFDPGRWEE